MFLCVAEGDHVPGRSTGRAAASCGAIAEVSRLDKAIVDFGLVEDMVAVVGGILT